MRLTLLSSKFNLIIYCNIFIFILVSGYHQPESIERRRKRICPGVHIRNDLKSFDQLRGCDVIDGPLTIALVSNHSHPYEHKDYEKLAFPDLKEVTEYLLFFRVSGLRTLSTLFPNLAVIRGKELVSDYALIIYEMMHLETIELPKLSDILRGSVRIENNPNLCYTSTVNWEGICKHPFRPHFIKENNPRCINNCPEHCRPWKSKENLEQSLVGDYKELGAANNKSLFCWSSQSCHELCQTPDGMGLPMSDKGGCCSPQCAGGCEEPDRSDRCVSCRSVSQEGKCVEHCDYSLFEYKGQCINEQACILMIETVQQNQCGKSEPQATTSNLKAIRLATEGHGHCQVDCPAGYEEDPTNKNKCKPCDQGKCRKVCTPQSDKPFMVTNVNSLRDLSGCNVINGSLEISMKGGKNVLHELETAFQDLEEIKGYLKVTRSYPILTFGFLSRLRAINGSQSDRGHYALTIIDNPNLQELFVFDKQGDNQGKRLNINGRIFVHLNPKLCPHRVDNLKTYANVKDWDETDVSLHTNGDKEACNTQRLGLEFLHGTARAAMIRFQNFALKMNDPRSLLYYLVNYREASNGNVTMFDGRDGCNSQSDVWQTLEVSPINQNISSKNKTDEYQDAIIKVKPATRYALYVKTFTTQAGVSGALSDMIYFETAPDTPGIPRHLEVSALSAQSIQVSWSPPTKPNGIIERYLLTVTKYPEKEELQNFDICDSTKNRNDLTRTLTKDESASSSLVPSHLQTSQNVTNEGTIGRCMSSSSEAVEIHTEVVTFQDLIIDIVYLKQPCPNTTHSPRRRRSIDYSLQPSASESKVNDEKGNRQSPKIQSGSGVQLLEPLKFARQFNKTEFNVSAHVPIDGRLTYIIENLDHYSRYTIEVKACHGDFKGTGSQTAKTYERCGIQALSQIRTLPIEDNDRVESSSIIFHPANETSTENRVTWKPPLSPNGLVLAYRVKLSIQDSGITSEYCINNTAFERNKGFVLPSGLPRGSILLKIRTVSMHTGQELWSEPELRIDLPIEFWEQPVVIVFTLIALLFVLGSTVAACTYYYQKKKHERLIYASVNPDYIQYDPDEWEVDKSNIQVGPQIGTGAFGMVYKGQLITEKGSISCAIKTVPPTSTTKQRMDFLREASIMKQFDTFHVVKLMGVVSVTNPVYVIMEFMENGDLKSYLRNQREKHEKQKKPVVDGIYLMAAQIADGMAYLASKKFVHRDLAARNCMVGENGVVKIGDFGLARDIYENDYYRRGTNCRLPVRWMAPESLQDRLYTSASDVWSYGIVVWEIVTFSASPYPGMDNEDVIKRVMDGFTMSRPENCPSKLNYIMERCWRRNAKDRPTFIDIVESLLPETEDKLYPNCFYKKPKVEGGDSTAISVPEENNVQGESYPLLSWPTNQANGTHPPNREDRETSDLKPT